MTNLLYQLARGGGAVLQHPVYIVGLSLLHLLYRLSFVFALCKHFLPIAYRQEAVHRDEVEVGSTELLRVFGGLLLRLEDGYRGAHIRQRVMGVVELLAVVTPIDIGQAA